MVLASLFAILTSAHAIETKNCPEQIEITVQKNFVALSDEKITGSVDVDSGATAQEKAHAVASAVGLARWLTPQSYKVTKNRVYRSNCYYGARLDNKNYLQAILTGTQSEAHLEMRYYFNNTEYANYLRYAESSAPVKSFNRDGLRGVQSAKGDGLINVMGQHHRDCDPESGTGCLSYLLGGMEWSAR